MAIIRFAEWSPDLPALENPGATVARNVYPAANSYRPCKSLVALSEALGGRVFGAISVKDANGDVRVYAATASEIFSLVSSAWTSQGSGYSTNSEENWRFIEWLGDTIIGTNFSNTPQTATIGGLFSDLGGSPPVAKYPAVVRDFVLLGHTSTNPTAVQWSGKGNSATWAASLTTQAGAFTLPSGNRITGIAGGEFGVIITESTVWLMQYRGPPSVFQFDETLRNVGTVIPNSIVQQGQNVFMYGKDGFRVIQGGRQSQLIGNNRVDRYFSNNLDESNAHRVSAINDPFNKRIHWAYPTQDANGVPNRFLTYSWAEDRWTEQEYDVELLTVGAESGQTLESLDNFSANIDDLPISLDDPFWAGGGFQIAAFTVDHKLAFFTGDTKTATIETGELQLSEGRKSFVRRVRPLVEDTSATVTIGTRDRQTENVVYGPQISQNANGVCPTRSNARYHRLKVETSGDFTHLQGIELNREDFSSAGRTR